MKFLSGLTTALVAFLICTNIFAQSDSTEYDLGRIRLQKDFTQAITLKGKDLEKIPFASLEDAVNVWFYGTLTGKSNLVYVIDGNTIADPNAYSVYDIEEISLIQNAAIMLNGAASNAFLVLITTRHPKDHATGLQIGLQTALVSRKPQQGTTPDNEEKSEKNLYHKYYLSLIARKNNTSFRLSGSYLRDVMPSYKTESLNTKTPFNLQRIGLAGELNSKISPNSEFSIFANYVPQFAKSESTISSLSSNHDFEVDNKQSLLYTGTQFTTRLFEKLTSRTTFSYSTVKTENENQHSENTYITTFTNDIHSNIFLLRENLSYSVSAGSWAFTPSLNFTFRYLNNNYKQLEMSYSKPSSLPIEYRAEGYSSYGRLYTLSPSLNITYSNSFNLNGGIVTNLSYLDVDDIKRVFPFVSTSLDVIQLLKKGSASNLKFFASLANTQNLFDNYYQLDDFHSYFTQTSGDMNIYANPALNNNKTSIQFGSSLGLFNSTLKFDYNHEKRETTELILLPDPTGYRYATIMGKTWYNRFRLTGKVSETDHFSWQPGLSLTRVKSEYDGISGTSESISLNDKSWNGGFVNRLGFGNFQVGIDFLFKLNETKYNLTRKKDDVYNSFGLQNLYFGYQFKTSNKVFDLYFTGRNILANDDARFSDNRRYYGLGLKGGF
jgi:hypothetical protein